MSKQVKNYNLRLYDEQIDLAESEAKKMGLPTATFIRMMFMSAMEKSQKVQKSKN